MPFFSALGKFDVVVTGDIGCYSLGVAAPLTRMDTILCMGAGISMAHGMKIAGEKKRVVGIVGDSTFFHSGITALLDIGYNKSAPVIIILDNRVTAMTGHQDNPGSGLTLMGEPTHEASIEELARACGISTSSGRSLVQVRDAFIELLKNSFETPEPTVIISAHPASCMITRDSKALKVIRMSAGPVSSVSRSLPGHGIHRRPCPYHNLLCGGCSLCEQICPFDAIS